jgi:DNA-binding transcriptional LysR family regulator
MAYQSQGELEELVAFVAVNDAQGFTAAARVMHGRKATLSKRVQDLEQRLGVSLLVRTTRSLRLTEEGNAYLQHARRALAAARDAEAAVLSSKAKPRGVLRVSSAVHYANSIIERIVVAYLAKYPEVRVQLDTSERLVDLTREGFDLAIRVGPLHDSSLIARKLGTSHGGFYASPRYLAKRGQPRRPEELAAHDTIVIPKSNAGNEWPFWVGGKRKLFPVQPRLLVTDLGLAAQAAAAGVGILRAPLQVAAPYLEKKLLVPILQPFTLPSLEVNAVYPAGGSLVPKTRLFLELLEAWFRKQSG